MKSNKANGIERWTNEEKYSFSYKLLYCNNVNSRQNGDHPSQSHIKCDFSYLILWKALNTIPHYKYALFN